jgi:lambda family phage portal protein
MAKKGKKKKDKNLVAKSNDSQFMAYDAADFSSTYLNRYRFYQSGSEDDAIVTDLDEIRRKLREGYRNNAVVASIVNNVTAHTILDGFSFSCDLNLDDPEETQEMNRYIESRWKDFEETIDASGEGMGLTELARILTTSWFVDGDGFGLVVGDSSGDDFKSRLRLVPAENVNNPANSKNNNEVKLGIEVNAYGDKQAIHVEKSKSKSGADSHARFRYKDYKTGLATVLHLYDRKFPVQTRGLPLLTTCYNAIRDLDSFMKTELKAAQVSSNYNMIIETPHGVEMAQSLNARGKNVNTTGNPQKDARPPFYTDPGSVNVLAPGEVIKQMKLERPQSVFHPFVVAQLKIICSSIGLSYAYVFHDTSELNGASARFDMRSNQVVLKQFQEKLIEKLYRPLTSWFVMELAANGELGELEPSEVMKACHWRTPRFAMLDPQREVEACVKAIDGKLLTYQQAIGELYGNDYEETHRQLGAEIRKMEELGTASDDAKEVKHEVSDGPGRPPGEDSTRS